MVMGIPIIILFLGVLVFLSHFLSSLFERTRVPDALILILIGLVIGPVLGLVTPSSFGAVGPVFTTITLIIILFESSIGLSMESLRKSLGGTARITALNFVVTAGTIGSLATLAGLDLPVAFAMGSILGGTSSAIVVSMIRQMKMGGKSGTILILESAVSDLLTITVSLALLEAYELGGVRPGLVVGEMISSFSMSAFMGIAGGVGWSILLHKVRQMQNAIFTTPAFVFIIYALVELMGYSGAIAALAFGAALGNIKMLRMPFLRRYTPHDLISLNRTEKLFFAEAVFLLRTFFFVYVGLSIITDLWTLYMGLALSVILFALRLPVVRVSIPKSIPPQEAILMAGMVPKGLAAAVLASVPLQRGVAGGEVVQGIVYSVILFSIAFTSLMVFLLERTKLRDVYGAFFRGFGREAGSA